MAQERNLAKDQDQERWDSSGKAHLIFVTFVADCVKILDLHYHVKAILQSRTCLQLRCPLALGSLIPGQRKDTQGSLDIDLGVELLQGGYLLYLLGYILAMILVYILHLRCFSIANPVNCTWPLS